MNLFARFRKRNKKKEASPSIVEILNSNGFNITEEEIQSTMQRLLSEMDFRKVLPEAMWSEIGELSKKGSKYVVNVSMLEYGNEDNLQAIFMKATMFAAVSEIAGEKGLSQYVIKRDALVSLDNGIISRPHPLNTLLGA